MPAPINHWSASAGSSCWPWSPRGAASRVTICRTAALWPSTGSVSCAQRSIRERWSSEAATKQPGRKGEGEGESAGRLECRWQRDQLSEAIRELVLDDQRLRNDICWSVFDC